jgi:hypothetical protein
MFRGWQYFRSIPSAELPPHVKKSIDDWRRAEQPATARVRCCPVNITSGPDEREGKEVRCLT